MTEKVKKKPTNVEDVLEMVRTASNKGLGNAGTCSTAAATEAKEVTLGSTFELVDGATILVTFQNAITVASATLAVTHTPLGESAAVTEVAKPIYYRGAALGANLIKAGMMVQMRYNGTQWDIISNIEDLNDYLQVNAQNFSNAQKQQARTNIGAQEDVTDMAKLGCGIGTCSTDSGTALVVSLTDYELVKNGHVSVNFEHDVPAGATLNINGKGAKPIIHKGSAIEADTIKAGDTVMFAYDGTNFNIVGGGGGSSVDGTITVSLVPIVSGSQYAASLLNGVTVELWNVSDNKTVETKIWAGSQISFTKIMAAKTYKLKFSQKYGYTTPQDSQEFVLGVGETYNVGTIEYTADKYVLNVSTNQSDDTDLASTVIRVSATGISADGYLDFTGAQSAVEVLVPKGATVTAACQSGQPSAISYKQTITVVQAANPEGGTPVAGSVTALYETEAVTVMLSADDGSDVSAQQATVKDHSDSSVIGTVTSGQTLKIAFGTAYDITVADIRGYNTPTFSTRTAASATYTAELEWVYNPIKYAYVKIDQSQSGDTAIITVSETQNGTAQTLNQSTGKHANAALQALRDSSHLYMGKFASNKMTLRQLKDDDGTKYLDGTTAKFDGTDGDHFLRIGEPFYIKRVSGSNSGNQVTYGIAVGGQPDNTWKQIISPNDLLGVHEAYLDSSKFYSRSGVQSSANFTRDTAKTYARNRGTGFTCVTWEWHCVMALLFFAWYGRTNAQAQCGTGANSYTRTLGAKNALGMTDTTASNGNTDDVKFWGIENWWGDKYEFIDNADVNDLVWTITNTKTGATRNAGTAGNANGWITKLMLSDNLDMIPTAVGGAETTYFCDYYWQNTGARVVLRSCSDAYTHGGVVIVYAYHVASYSHAGSGSRLAFNGTIEIS